MDESNQSRHREKMDGETAIAFAIEQFQQLHTRESCPQWLSRCTTIGYHWDDDDRYIISFAVTPKCTNDAVSYFKVAVDPTTAAIEILFDRNVSDFTAEELQGF